MAKIQVLTILLTVTCFLGGVVSVTDMQFEDLVSFVHQQAAKLEQQSVTIEEQSEHIKHLIDENTVMREDNKRQDMLIEELNTRQNCDVAESTPISNERLILNDTLEERVASLETQVIVIEEDVTDLEGDVNFLFDEQVIQDERLLGLEQGINVIESDLDVIDDELENVLATTITLDFRVTALEENGGGNGNSSVAELEVRVETLEGTAADHETRISVAETDINDLEEDTSDQETRLTAAEENIQGLQMTDVELDERVTALEENTGGGAQNDTIAFHSVLTSYSSIPDETEVEFNEVVLNEGDGYDSTTGTFTVPSGGDGFYYFSTYLLSQNTEYNLFDIQINGQVLCSVNLDQNQTSGDDLQSACSAATYAVQGDEVQVVSRQGDTTPLVATTAYYYCGFTGFRI